MGGRILVCPQPGAWAKVHRQLREEAERRNLPPPPIPLILHGWAYTNDIEKAARWEETLAWADQHSLTLALKGLSEDEYYSVDRLTEHVVGPLGGPMYLEWNSVPRRRADKTARAEAIHVLMAAWPRIAGPELAGITQPSRLTGAKGRRLVVLVLGAGLPPWGSWEALPDDDTRGTFRALRSAVNEAIAPHQVDHIDFIRQDTINGMGLS